MYVSSTEVLYSEICKNYVLTDHDEILYNANLLLGNFCGFMVRQLYILNVNS